MGKENKQGYVLYVGTDKTQVDSAYALALSIKCVDSRPLALVVDKFDTVPSKYEKSFDFIIELPYGPSDYLTGSTLADIWQVYYATPFEQSLYIKSTSLLMNNIDDVWKSLNSFDLVLPTHTLNMQGNVSEYRNKNTVQERNNLPVYHADVFYFAKSEPALEFFKMCDPVFKNWRELTRKYTGAPDWFSVDQMFSIVSVMLGVNPVHYYQHLTYVDTSVDNIIELDSDIPNDWLDSFNIWFEAARILRINNHRQNNIVVYNHKKFINKENLDELTKRYQDQKRYTN